ncbi:MAG: aminotransferase class IV [Planctomycetota bacterium]
MQQQFDDRNQSLVYNVNGRLIGRDEPGLSPFDSSVQGGDAVWEGLRVYEGKIFRLQQHLERLRHSAKALAFSEIPGDDAIRTEIRRTLEANSMHDDVHIRLTLTRGVKITSGMDPRLNQAGPTLIVLAEHKPPVYGSEGITLHTSSIRRFRADQMDPKIHHNNLIQSILAKIEANAAGADDALMLDSDGFIAETNATHVFCVEGGTVVTSTCKACPEGVTRSVVLKLCEDDGIPFRVGDYSQAELYRADEAFCTGTMGELVPVFEVDGRPIGEKRMGPVTEALRTKFRGIARTQAEAI